MTPVRSTPAAQPMTAGRPSGSQERPGDPGERRRALVEHVAVRGRDPVGDCLVGHERQVPVADLVRITEDAGTALDLVGPADVDHLADPKVVQRPLRGDRELVEGIGSKERPPASLPAVAGRVATDIAQVARAGEAEKALRERGSVGSVGGHEARRLPHQAPSRRRGWPSHPGSSAKRVARPWSGPGLSRARIAVLLEGAIPRSARRPG